jgi:hypothetical protein
MLKILGVRRKQVQNSLGDKKQVRMQSRHCAFKFKVCKSVHHKTIQ